MSGRLIVICGPMFAGKTSALILRVERAKRGNKGIQVFVPSKDQREGLGQVISHSKQNIEAVGVSATALEDAHGLASYVRPNVSVVAIDEVQFFGEDVRREIQKLVATGREVVVAGLDMDFKAEPFGVMPSILSIAHEVIKMKAVCAQCGEDASYTYRKNTETKRVYLGASESYEARCTSCYFK